MMNNISRQDYLNLLSKAYNSLTADDPNIIKDIILNVANNVKSNKDLTRCALNLTREFSSGKCLFKSIKGIGNQRSKKAKVIEQLRCQFPLSALLKAAKMSRSTFYYQRSHEEDRQNKKVMFQIKKIFDRHHGNYGYRRITCVLRHNGHKKVKRLMKAMGLFGKVIRKRNRYSSYKEQLVKSQIIKLNVNSAQASLSLNAIRMLLSLN